MYVIATNACRHANTGTHEHTHNTGQRHSIRLLLLEFINCIIWTVNSSCQCNNNTANKWIGSFNKSHDLTVMLWGLTTGLSSQSIIQQQAGHRFCVTHYFVIVEAFLSKNWVAVTLPMCIKVANAKCRIKSMTEIIFFADFVWWQIWCTNNIYYVNIYKYLPL